MRFFAFLGTVLLALAMGLPASAQQKAPQHPFANIRGRIVTLAGHRLTVATREGRKVEILLAPNAAVRALAGRKLSDIKDGDYLGIASIRGRDGKQHALEVALLPPSVPEIQSPWDLQPGSMMTNAHVSGIVMAKGERGLWLTYKGHATEFVVDPRTPIVGPAAASMNDLDPGRYVFLRATKDAHANWHAASVIVEKNGIKPPM